MEWDHVVQMEETERTIDAEIVIKIKSNLRYIQNDLERKKYMILIIACFFQHDLKVLCKLYIPLNFSHLLGEPNIVG